MAQIILSTKQKQTQITVNERKLVAGVRGEGMGWTGSLGLVDANCYIWNGWAVGSSYSIGNCMIVSLCCKTEIVETL